jgi:glycosyltransferase involved in cell wall biosynthesis
MKILFLTQTIPYPVDAGPKVKTWHVLKHLVDKGYDVTLVSFVRGEEEKYINELRKVFSEVFLVPLHRSRMADLAYWTRSLFSGRPFLIERDDIPSMRSLISDLMDRGSFDVVHADQLTMAQFVLTKGIKQSKIAENEKSSKSRIVQPGNNIAKLKDTPKRIFDAHNALWALVRRMRKTSRFYFRPFLSLEARRIKRYEGMVVRSFDYTLAVSRVDRDALTIAEKEYSHKLGYETPNSMCIHIIPIAIDTSGYRQTKLSESRSSILTLGTLHWPPNADGIRWFIRDIFPRVREQIPGVSLTVIGKNPPSDLVNIAATMSEAVSVKGYVKDLQPYLEAADVMVVPVRAGGGMRVRILEGFAWGLPMVTTTVGLEGIEAVPGKDIMVADDVGSFAKAVCTLMESEALRLSLRENGLQLVNERYDWRVVLRELDQVYA